MAGKIKCEIHGTQDESFVCRHIVESLRTGVPVGFHWSKNSTSQHPDAWCTACNEARVKAGGDWTDALYAILDIKLLCGACYDHAKDIWMRGRKLMH
jgi:hypothetical protein